MSYSKVIALLVFSVALTACSSTPEVPDPEPTDTTYDGGASTDGMDNADPFAGESMDDPYAGELGDVIYFEFDSSDVRSQDNELVSRHAMALAENSGRSVRLEGHGDERGSREYNIGLGERRAQAVRQMLMIQGVSASQIQTVSFGEERPDAMGSSESDYARNRRVVFVY